MTIEGLKNEIEKQLSPLIDRDYCLLGVPMHSNVGDNAIWQGEVEFLRNLKNVKQKYSCGAKFFDPKKIEQNDIILIQGGGHFGDLYKKFQDFKNQVVTDFKNNRIIMFPVSVFFADEAYLAKTKDIFSSHKDLTICARDAESYEFLKKNFSKNRVLLVPDMAVFIDIKSLLGVTSPIPKKDGKKVLFLERNDKELKEKPDFKFPENFTVSGWSKAGEGSVLINLKNLLNRVIGIAFRFLKIDYNHERGFFSFGRKKREDYIREGLNHLSEFDLIITQRLHGHILATMLGIPSILLDISYGKNRNFYKTWTKDIPGTYFAENMDELRKILKNDFSINVSDPTNEPRVKIDFIGIGAPKCGTTWVYECLRKHPNICVSVPKEIHYFNEQDFIDWRKPNQNHKKPLSWYEQSYAHCKKESIKGEFSTNYLYSTEAPALIKKLYPQVKLILCLRNPVDRAYSHYWMNKKEQRRLQESFEEVAADSGSRQLERGFYCKYLNQYLKYFDAHQICIVLLEDIKDRPIQTLKKILDHIGVDSGHAESLISPPKNVAKESRSVLLPRLISSVYKLLIALHLNFIIHIAHKIGIKKFYMKFNFKELKNPPMNPETRKYLTDLYKEDVKDLERLIGRDLSHWMR